MLHGSDAPGAGRGLLVLTQASSEAAHVVASGLGQPGGERVRGAGADQGTKAEGEIANHGQRQRQQPLDTDAIRFRRQQPSQLRASGPHAGLDMSQADEKLARPGSLLAHSVTTRIPPAKSATRRSPQNRTPLRQHSGQRRSSTAHLEVKRMPLTSYSAPHGVAQRYQFASDVTDGNALLVQPRHVAMDKRSGGLCRLEADPLREVAGRLERYRHFWDKASIDLSGASCRPAGRTPMDQPAERRSSLLPTNKRVVLYSSVLPLFRLRRTRATVGDAGDGSLRRAGRKDQDAFTIRPRSTQSERATGTQGGMERQLRSHRGSSRAGVVSGKR